VTENLAEAGQFLNEKLPSTSESGIKGATPAEMYCGKSPARLNAVRPARACQKKGDDRLFEIAYLDPERLLPVLIPKAA